MTAPAQTSSGIGPVTICGITMNTWHDAEKAFLRVREADINGTLVPAIRKMNNSTQYLLLECNSTTVQSSEDFKRLMNKGLIIFLMRDGRIVQSPEIGLTKDHVHLLQLPGSKSAQQVKVNKVIVVAADAAAQTKKNLSNDAVILSCFSRSVKIATLSSSTIPTPTAIAVK